MVAFAFHADPRTARERTLLSDTDEADDPDPQMDPTR
jgi:hypothetical protein